MAKRISGLTVSDLIDNIVDHNSVVALWETDKDEPHYMNEVWRGTGWAIPDPYNDYKFVRIFSSVPETLEKGDVVNIEVTSKTLVNTAKEYI